MKNEYFRGVVWPRAALREGKQTNYRYVVVGMLVTNEPIENIEGTKNGDGISQNFLDGTVFGMADALSLVPQRETSRTLGTADDVLTSLEYL